MASCRASFTHLTAPLTLAELAVHLATRKNFVIHPCRERSLRPLHMLAGPYGYNVLFDADRELVTLQYRHGPQTRLQEVAVPARARR
jgi:hypothetical protein